MSDLWNRCDECGKLIAYKEFRLGKATRTLVTPDSEFTQEEWETLCRLHTGKKKGPVAGSVPALDCTD